MFPCQNLSDIKCLRVRNISDTHPSNQKLEKYKCLPVKNNLAIQFFVSINATASKDCLPEASGSE